MKKKILVCAFIAVCLSIVAYSTLAYFTYEGTASNIITMGNIRLELQQLAVSEDGRQTAPAEDAMDVLPGTSVSRIVQIKNVGAQPAWIRISVEKAVTLAQGVSGQADLSLISFDINTEMWVEKDGYYYYQEALQPGQTTEPLFTQVQFSGQMGNLYQQSKAMITVTAQATQTANNGENVFQAAGWPADE